MCSDISQQYENDAIYVVLSLRGAQPGFHWGIFVPTSTPTGCLWHATNRTGAWAFVEENTREPLSQSLCLAFKIGVIKDRAAFRSTLAAIPADGTSSRVTGDAFSCRTWAKDALHALDAAHIIALVKSIAEIEGWAIETAEAHRRQIELGTSSAQVVDQLGVSVKVPTAGNA